ncbi:DUF192 domain-containing protein [Arundinibacter roseus]|uniref:DUF192 domain-containing protein n=1 Tax=Arundinibacter roseus TaxID=2070510 RepID=A0A4R4KR59_9BACT|nr:DUF192 domain-containing protein [Arundinibacter roseus]TDB68891.1 DUF192 domain-containing protein [Arundinibacter roseus]
MRTKQSYFAYILLTVFIIGGLGYVLVPFLKKDRNEPSSGDSETAKTNDPVFVKEGELRFVRDGRVLKKIDVEIAENEAERAKGLMYRPYLPDSTGMLFIFERAEPQAFWMKNTQMPLDIIYVDQARKIVSIQKNAQPFSEESLPSLGEAQYVVEVNAGYCDLHDIQVGDSIEF